jgi:hypothetical protein
MTAATSIELSSSAFADGAAIPQTYTCDGEDVSPPLAWTAPPAGTQSFVLICDDPDAPAGTWVHWIAYNLPADVLSLPEAVAGDDDLPGDAVHGKNGWGRQDYGGPCPPSGTHHYSFRLYALDTELDLQPGARKAKVLRALEGHVLAQGELIGTYQRP